MEEKSRGGRKCEQRTGINQKHEICMHGVTWWCGLRGSTQVTDKSPALGNTIFEPFSRRFNMKGMLGLSQLVLRCEIKF
jgi:hypothetical protein